MDQNEHTTNITDDPCSGEQDEKNGVHQSAEDNIEKDKKKDTVENEHQPEDKQQDNHHVTKEWILPMLVVGVVAFLCGIYISNNDDPVGPYIATDFECPDSPIYIPTNSGFYQLDPLKQYNVTTGECDWTFDKNKKPKNLAILKKKCLLNLKNIESTGIFDVKLTLKYRNNEGEKEKTKCDIKLIFHPVPYFGIDLGTTYSSIAYQSIMPDSKGKFKPNIVPLIVDKVRKRYSMPTAIFIPPSDDEQIKFGQDALDMRHKYPQNVIYDIKRIMGRRPNDARISLFADTHSFLLDVHKKKVVIKIPKYVYNQKHEKIGEKYEYWYPEETLAPILTYLVHTASKDFNVPYISDIVISVPAYFTNNQRKATKNACKIAGLNPMLLVVEPTAAALAYSHYDSLPKSNFDLFMVFDYGGGTLDCSILQCYGENCEVYYVGGNSTLGGIDFDHVIVDIMKSKYKTQHNWKSEHFTQEMNAKFLLQAEIVKMQLTKQEKSHPIYMNKKKIHITRDEFQKHPRTQKLINEAIKTAKETIDADPDHQIESLKMILMVGGTSRVPLVQNKLRAAFPSIDIPDPDEECELTVVKGSSVIGGALALGKGSISPNSAKENSNKTNINIDVTPLPLGFSVCIGEYGEPGTTCGNMDVVVNSGERYGVERKKEYRTHNAAQTSALLQLYEGKNKKVEDNDFLSEVTIFGFTEDIRTCNVIFKIDENGIVKINATVTGNDEIFTMNSLMVHSDDRGLTKKDITKLRHKMSTFGCFSSEIQKILSK